jgi:hypothetical protein
MLQGAGLLSLTVNHYVYKKNQVEITRGKMEVSRIGYAFRTYPSVNRVTPSTFALVV